MDHDQWGALAFFVLIILMMTPSTIDKCKRKYNAYKTTKPDTFFDSVTEFRNDFA